MLTGVRSVVLEYEDPHRQHDTEDAAPREIESNEVRELLADMVALREEAAEILREAQTSRLNPTTVRLAPPSNEHEERIPSGSMMRVVPTAVSNR